MKKILGIFLFALLMWGLNVSTVAASMAPGELVESTATKLLDTIKAEKENINQDPHRIYQLVDEIVLPHFDFPTMARRVLGKYWKRSSVQQRKDFTMVFRDLLVRTYSNSLTEYTDQKITYFPVRESANAKKVVVRSEVELASGNAVEVAYTLSNKKERWMVNDIKIDGVSLVTNYRSSFSREIDRNGIESLIMELDAKNKKGAGVE